MERSFKHFVKKAWHILEPDTPLIWGWHIDAICDHLQAVSEGKIKRLIISISPGSMKSLLTAVFWPAWEWTFRKSARYVVASHSLAFASRDSLRCRDLITSKWYSERWPLELKDDANTTLKYINEQTGYRWALPYSKLTGGRGNRLLIDDPISVMDALNSDVERIKVNETFLASATSRLNNPKTDAIVIIAQRIHMDDLIGRLLSLQMNYVHLNIPMEYTGDVMKSPIGWTDPRTIVGELMLPEQRGHEEIDELKRLNIYAYSAQYQQNPVPDTDGYFKRDWFKRFDLAYAPENLNYYITSDHAPGGGSSNDYNVVRVWGLDSDKNMYLVDWFREQCDLSTAMGITNKDGKLAIASKGALAFVKKYKPLIWFAEPDNNFKSIREMIGQTMISTGVVCRIEYSSLHNKNKVEKAVAYQGWAQNGKVYIPNGIEGDQTILEYTQFPTGKHDDRVDADSILAREIKRAYAAIALPDPDQEKKDRYKEMLVDRGYSQSHLFS